MQCFAPVFQSDIPPPKPCSDLLFSPLLSPHNLLYDGAPDVVSRYPYPQRVPIETTLTLDRRVQARITQNSEMDTVLADVVPRQFAVKLLYTFDAALEHKFLARPAGGLEARIDEEAGLGLVEVSQCVEAVLETSPELSQLVRSSDVAVYSRDFAEEDAPLMTHGRLSDLTAVSGHAAFAIGKICKSRLWSDQLEIQLHFARLEERKRPRHDHDQLQADYPAKRISMFPPSSPPPPPSTRTRLAGHPHIGGGPTSTRLFAAGKSQSVQAPLQLSVDLAPEELGAISVPQRESSCLQLRGAKNRHRLLQSLQDGEVPQYCANCGAVRTSTWRRSEIRGAMLTLCNACGIYFRTKGVMRPEKLWDKPERTKEATPKSPKDADSSNDQDSPEPASDPPSLDPPSLTTPSSPQNQESSSDMTIPSTPPRQSSNKENVPPSEKTPNSVRKFMHQFVFPASDSLDIFLATPTRKPQSSHLSSSPPPSNRLGHFGEHISLD